MASSAARAHARTGPQPAGFRTTPSPSLPPSPPPSYRPPPFQPSALQDVVRPKYSIT
jgi:hypothetical protein